VEADTSMNRKMEIICVGNELLIGKTLNTNATWLAKQATSLGIEVKRITIVGDYIDEIANATQETLQRKPRFIITTGGLGPTFDDKTLEGIAKALNLKLKVNKEALQMVVNKYEAYFKKKITKSELTPARVKMATLPEGARALRNPVGTAPGVMIDVEETALVALPGVPPEMEAIFQESVVTLIKKEAGNLAFFEKSMFVNGIVESALAPLIDQVMLDNHGVYVKSHVYVKSKVVCEGKKSEIELHLSMKAENAKNAEKCLKKAATQLAKLIEKNGGKVT
jgi:molybdenum cofactor synthesis domain-containing protein